jgi:hypothetical protein
LKKASRERRKKEMQVEGKKSKKTTKTGEE